MRTWAGVKRQATSGSDREGESTDAEHRGGAARSSDEVYKSGFDPTVNVRLRHSFNGGHDGEADSMLSRTRASLAPAQPVLCILDNIDPLAKLAAKR